MISSSNPMKICKVKINCVLYLRVRNEIIESIVLAFQNYFNWYSLIKSNITLSGFNNCRWLTIFLNDSKNFQKDGKMLVLCNPLRYQKIILFLVF